MSHFVVICRVTAANLAAHGDIEEAGKGPPEAKDAGKAVLSWAKMVAPGDDRAAWNDIVEAFDREAFFRDYLESFNPLKPYAVLDETGWNAPGRMGWFGCSDDTPEAYLGFVRGFGEWLRASPHDALLVAVDCHI